MARHAEQAQRIIEAARKVEWAYMSYDATLAELATDRAHHAADDLWAEFQCVRKEAEMVPAGENVPQEIIRSLFDILVKTRMLLKRYPHSERALEIQRWIEDWLDLEPKCPYGNRNCPHPERPMGGGFHAHCLELMGGPQPTTPVRR